MWIRISQTNQDANAYEEKKKVKDDAHFSPKL